MCLGIPGEVLNIEQNAAGIMMGRVSFGGVVREVCLAYVPDVQVGDYVIVHAGFALNKLNEEEAREVFEMLEQMSALTDTDPAGDT
ncbi:MAG: HypC/HybG/HupF family hydrogenase formation chaperone [Anaerolineae bacterium]